MSSKRHKHRHNDKEDDDDDDDNKALQKAILNSFLPQEKKKSPKKAIKKKLLSPKKTEKSRKRLASPSSKKQKSPKKSKKNHDDEDNIMRLRNKGNSCFANAALQLIDSLSFLPNSLVDSNKDTHKHKTEKLLVDLIRERNTGNQIDKLLIQEDDYTKRKYYNGSQEDTGEFLMSMLYFLNKKYINVSFKEITSFDNCEGFVPETADRDLPYINLYLNNKSINDLQSLLDDEQKTIPLQKPTEKIHGIGGCLSKKLTYSPNPTTRNIIIQLSRFIGSTENAKKNKQKITPPSILRFYNGSLFELTGCIIHIGQTIGNGHYTYLSFKKDGEPHQYIDDLSSDYVQNYVKRVNNNYETNGYIYLYTKKD